GEHPDERVDPEQHGDARGDLPGVDVVDGAQVEEAAHGRRAQDPPGLPPEPGRWQETHDPDCRRRRWVPASAGGRRTSPRRGTKVGVRSRPQDDVPPPGAAETGAMITVTNLVKRYGDGLAVDDVSFSAQPGRVTGFLGPNGAGKSTTMRILTGLTPATSGAALVLGRPYSALTNPGRHVGVLLDASAQHAGRTGREVLTLGAMTLGIDRRRVDQMLELVGLTPKEGNRRIRNYSLGMRQRLGIAHALRGDPEVLVLDEPANGLEPAGIRWMPDLLKAFADAGGTVLLPSHLLNEIERIADDIVVIGHGRIVAQGTKEELLRPSGTLVRSIDDAALARALDVEDIEHTAAGSGGLQVQAEPARVGAVAQAAGVALVELRPADHGGLEEIFLQLTADDSRQEVAA